MKVSLPTQNFQKNFLQELCAHFDFLERDVYGKSLCGRPLEAYYLGNRQNAALLCGGFHGSEYLTVLALLQFLEDLCKSVERKKTLAGFRVDRFLTRRGVCIVPCVNPDGTEIAISGSSAADKYKSLIDSITADTSDWRANARGVDINHNFDAGWDALKQRELSEGITKPARTRYGGEHAESEPESRALAELFRNGSFRIATAFHSQGREIYCDYGANTPRRSFDMAEILSRSSGYKIAAPESIATGGGFKDWVIDKYSMPALTIEIGLGKNPLPLSDFEPEYQRILELLCFCSIL